MEATGICRVLDIMDSKRVIHQVLASILNWSSDESSSMDSINEIVLQQLCRTRIGEYCLNELSRTK